MANIVGTAPAASPMRRYYAWQAQPDTAILYVEDVLTKVRYSVQCEHEEFNTMREWSDTQWHEWIERDLARWLNR